MSKVSEVRKWCKKGHPPDTPTPDQAIPTVNIPIPTHLQQQAEYTSLFRAILHPPKTLPAVSTHQYNTRLRRALTALRLTPSRNTKTHSSTLQPRSQSQPDPNLDTNQNPNPNSTQNPDHDTNPHPPLLDPAPITLNLDQQGKPLSYKSAKSGPDRHHWVIAEAEEILRLIFTGTLFPIAYSDVPFDRRGDIVYYNPVVKQKWNDDGTIKFRVRGTAGGNLLDVPYDVSARTASLNVVKLLLIPLTDLRQQKMVNHRHQRLLSRHAPSRIPL